MGESSWDFTFDYKLLEDKNSEVKLRRRFRVFTMVSLLAVSLLAVSLLAVSFSLNCSKDLSASI